MNYRTALFSALIVFLFSLTGCRNSREVIYKPAEVPETLAVDSVLDQAERVAGLILNHPNYPADGIPYGGLDALSIPDTPKDAAAAILASGLAELATFSEIRDKALYRSSAKNLITSLASGLYCSAIDENDFFLMNHCAGNFPVGTEIDVPVIYTDYYFFEALIKYHYVTNSINES